MVTALGRSALSFIEYFGELVLLAYETIRAMVVAPIRWGLFARQVTEIGWRSQLVVVVTGMFTGAVLTAQTYFQFASLGMKSAVGSVVAVALFRELGPTLAGLMMAGRVGAAIAAEIGTMKVTEQIDALRSLAVHPIDYLVVPRILALVLSMPLLVIQSVGLGIVSSYFTGVYLLGISGPYFVENLKHYVGPRDIKIALCKAFCFGIVIAIVSCHQGLNTKEGAEGVGRAPTEAVVNSSLTILVLNFFLTFLLNMLFPYGS
jgi:phospholipid/cholesterol/gamma-HCH transport system permease protein